MARGILALSRRESCGRRSYFCLRAILLLYNIVSVLSTHVLREVRHYNVLYSSCKSARAPYSRLLRAVHHGNAAGGLV